MRALARPKISVRLDESTFGFLEKIQKETGLRQSDALRLALQILQVMFNRGWACAAIECPYAQRFIDQLSETDAATLEQRFKLLSEKIDELEGQKKRLESEISEKKRTA